MSRFKSGGIGLFVKVNLSQYGKVNKAKHSKMLLWFTINCSNTHCYENKRSTVDFYIPLINSKYAHDDPYMELLCEMIRCCPNPNYELLMGAYFIEKCGYEYAESIDILNNFSLNNIPLCTDNSGFPKI